MKKWALALLCVLLAASVLCGGAAWMMLSPRGMLRDDKPEDVMQNAMDSMSRADWRDLYLSECSVDTGEFEDPAKVTGDIFDAAVPGDDFSFRPAQVKLLQKEKKNQQQKKDYFVLSLVKKQEKLEILL